MNETRHVNVLSLKKQWSIYYTKFHHKVYRVHTDQKKVEAILAAPTPINTQELKLFLGLVHYYRKVIPELYGFTYTPFEQGARSWKYIHGAGQRSINKHLP